MTLAQLPQPAASKLTTALGAKELRTFDELKLAVGERVKLEVRSPRARHTVTYLGAAQDRCLMVSMPVVNGVSKAPKEGAQLTLRFIALNQACGFSTKVLRVQSAPVPMLFLDYPDQIEAVRVRKAPRVNAKLVVSADEADPGNFGSGWPRQALCCDISLHGCRIEASDQLGEVGDALYITARVRVGEVDQVMMVEGVIRNLDEVEDNLNDGFRMVHGLEFIGLDEDTQLILTGYVYQQMLREQVGL